MFHPETALGRRGRSRSGVSGILARALVQATGGAVLEAGCGSSDVHAVVRSKSRPGAAAPCWLLEAGGALEYALPHGAPGG